MIRRTWINFIRRSIIDPVTNCWNWSGPVDKDGYAHYRYESGYPTFISVSSAYRLCYRIMKGVIPHNYEVDHLCKNKLCINPDHLEAVPHTINIQRGDTGIRNKEKTHCPQGHAYSPDNIHWHKRTNGTYSRRCKKCDNERNNQAYRRRVTNGTT